MGEKAEQAVDLLAGKGHSNADEGTRTI